MTGKFSRILDELSKISSDDLSKMADFLRDKESDILGEESEIEAEKPEAEVSDEDMLALEDEEEADFLAPKK